MELDLSSLSVQEIRRRYLRPGRMASPALLNALERDPRAGVLQVARILRKRRWMRGRESRRITSLLGRERKLWAWGRQLVAGVDECGMGPLAGPVVAAAVVFPPGIRILHVDDSKRLSSSRRIHLAEEIQNQAVAFAWGIATVEEIDALNIYQAGLLAMRRAVAGLHPAPEYVLTDARTIPELEMPQEPIPGGDGCCFSVAAASILAKTLRDQLMEELDRYYPEYGFARHKGYATRLHRSRLRQLGPCPAHRRSFLKTADP